MGAVCGLLSGRPGGGVDIRRVGGQRRHSDVHVGEQREPGQRVVQVRFVTLLDLRLREVDHAEL